MRARQPWALAYDEDEDYDDDEEEDDEEGEDDEGDDEEEVWQVGRYASRQS
jgi:hypothetical protein